MNNIRQFSSKEDIQEQACLWVSRLDRGLHDEEKNQLDEWLTESNSHRQALLDAASLWDDMSVLNELSGLFPQSYTRGAKQHKGMAKQMMWGMAATFFVMAVALSVIVQRTWFESAPQFANISEKVQTGVGEQKNVVLADGSKLHLNTNSIVTVDFSSNARNIVLLRGEAHFEVAHDKQRPFSVTAGSNTVTAVGTAFNMQYVDDNAFELVVTEGKVLVKDRFSTSSNDLLFGKKSITEEGLLMFAGEKATVQGKVEARENLSQNDIDDDLAWQQGMIVFKGEPLEAVLAEIGRYTPMRFSISDESLRKRRVAGYFKVGDIDGLLSALKSSFSIEHERITENSIQLTAVKG
ncbi:MAG: FecR domain-containing protein [Pseudomonadota bacterium]|tara:strand:+ start:842 stop:1894 length:1053 start_codon:yes stop_codon:yes gene_type:complete